VEVMALDRSVVKVIKENGFRKGFGFSLAELKEAKLTSKQTKDLQLPVDKRRKSCHKSNVETLLKKNS